jgi:hypothetical protein
MLRTFLDETVASLTQIEFPTELSMWQRDTLAVRRIETSHFALILPLKTFL